MKITILYFAIAKDLRGEESEVLEVPEGSETTDILAQLIREHKKLLPLKDCIRVAVNESFVEGSVVLKDGDVFAVIPPVSGG